MQPISTQNAACYIILSLKLLNRCGRYPSIPSVPTGSVYYTLLVTKYSVIEDNLLLSKSFRPGRWHQAVVTIVVCSQYLPKNVACYIILSLKLLRRCGRYPSITFRTDRICFKKPVRHGRWQEAVAAIVVCSQYLLKMLHVT